MTELKHENEVYYEFNNSMNKYDFEPQSPPELPTSYVSFLNDDNKLKNKKGAKNKMRHGKRYALRIFRRSKDVGIEKETENIDQQYNENNLIEKKYDKEYIFNDPSMEEIDNKYNSFDKKDEQNISDSMMNINSSSDSTFIFGNVTNNETRPIFPNSVKNKSAATIHPSPNTKEFRNISEKYKSSSIPDEVYTGVPKPIISFKKHDMHHIKKILVELKANKEKVAKTLKKLSAEISKWEETLNCLDPEVLNLTRDFKLLFQDEMMCERNLANGYNTMEKSLSCVSKREVEYINSSKNVKEANRNLQRIINKEGYNSEEYIFESEKMSIAESTFLEIKSHFQESILVNMKKIIFDYAQIKFNCYSKSKEIDIEILLHSLLNSNDSEINKYHELLKQIKNGQSSNSEIKYTNEINALLQKIENKEVNNWQNKNTTTIQTENAFKDDNAVPNFSYSDARLKTLYDSPITGNNFLGRVLKCKNENENTLYSRIKGTEEHSIENHKDNGITEMFKKNLEMEAINPSILKDLQNISIDEKSDSKGIENINGILFNLGEDEKKVEFEDENEVENNKWA